MSLHGVILNMVIVKKKNCEQRCSEKDGSLPVPKSVRKRRLQVKYR